MSMVFGLDLHRQQITFDALDIESGEVWRGRVWQPDRDCVRRWLRCDVAGKADGRRVALAVEGCTGWRYVVEEIEAAGFEAHLAEPADTQAARGRKRHAKTDRSDAALLRDLAEDDWVWSRVERRSGETTRWVGDDTLGGRRLFGLGRPSVSAARVFIALGNRARSA